MKSCGINEVLMPITQEMLDMTLKITNLRLESKDKWVNSEYFEKTASQAKSNIEMKNIIF